MGVGVDGTIADDHGIARGVENLASLEFSSSLRLATRSDNPFLPPDAAYGLTVRTSDISGAGTDANVTLTLTGAQASCSVSVDTSYNNRMERGLVNFLVAASGDLGELRFVTIQRDNRGNAPDWHVAAIDVESLRYRTKKTASFNCWIDTTNPVTRPLN
jgi:PLAT/LH2 domain-containing protein